MVSSQVTTPSQIFSPASVDDEYYRYNSLEQALQYNKAKDAGDIDTATRIMASTDPYEIMKMGSKVSVTAKWKKSETKLVYELLKSKFEPDHMSKLLLNTGDNNMYELTYNKVYGSGHHLGNAYTLTKDKVVGGNLLGLLLEKVRAEIKDEQDVEEEEEDLEQAENDDNPWEVPPPPQQDNDRIEQDAKVPDAVVQDEQPAAATAKATDNVPDIPNTNPDQATTSAKTIINTFDPKNVV